MGPAFLFLLSSSSSGAAPAGGGFGTSSLNLFFIVGMALFITVLAKRLAARPGRRFRDDEDEDD